MVFRGPVAQRIEHHIPHDRVIAVQGVARPAEVVVITFGGQDVIGHVIDAPEGDHRPVFVALGGVVEDHVQHDLDPVLVQLLDQGFDLIRHHCAIPGSAGGGKTCLGGKKADRAVTPIIQLQPTARLCGSLRLFSNSSNSKIGISSIQLIPRLLR